MHNSETGSSYKRKIGALASPYSDSSNCMSTLWSEEHGNDVKNDPFATVVNEGSANFARLDLVSHGRRIDFRTTARLLLLEQRQKIKCKGIFNSTSCLVEARINDEVLWKFPITTDVPCLV